MPSYLEGNSTLKLILTRGQFCRPQDIWQCVEMFLVVAAGRGYWHWVGGDEGPC